MADRNRRRAAEPQAGQATKEGEEPLVPDRWWADLGDKRRETGKRTSGPAGAFFFQSGKGFQQDRARSRLTDNNLKLLNEAAPDEGSWGHILLADAPHPEASLQRLKHRIGLPSYARGVIVDSGHSVRVLVTGTPIGARILELALGGAPSFDCWIDGEWVREELFSSVDAAIKAAQGLMTTYLSAEGIAAWEARRARA
jgi:hypothetical protein